MQCDGYAAYKNIANAAYLGEAITLAFCWAHLRRKFFEIAKGGSAPIASEALDRIALLYAIEKTIRGRSADERRAVRQEKSKPLVLALKIWLEEQLARVSAKSVIAEAIGYGLNHWDGLVRFLEDGRIDPRLSLVIVLGLAVLALAPNAQAQQPGVRAESGGIAVGNVSGSTITIGIPPEQLEALIRQSAEHSETQKKLISELEGKLDLNQRQVRAALDILGEKDIPPERLAARLVEIAERFKVLQATALAQPGDDAKIAALKAEAQKAIEAGDLTKADALLAEVESDQQRMLDTLAVNAAETSARRGDIALARLRYGDAARHFANAAAVFPPESTHQDKRIDNLQKEADALYRQGDEFGDNGALLSAIERKRFSDPTALTA